jgi:hypothetical protein
VARTIGDRRIDHDDRRVDLNDFIVVLGRESRMKRIKMRNAKKSGVATLDGMCEFFFNLRNRTSFRTLLEVCIATTEMLKRVVFFSSSTSFIVVD